MNAVSQYHDESFVCFLAYGKSMTKNDKMLSAARALMPLLILFAAIYAGAAWLGAEGITLKLIGLPMIAVVLFLMAFIFRTAYFVMRYGRPIR